MKMSKYIDHTLLKANATKEQILKLCEEAKEFDFASVCVNAGWVKTCKEALEGTDVKVCTVVGFPLGATTSGTKAFETKEAIENGADEIDMVMNIGAMKSQNYQLVEDDIRAVVEAAGGKCVKVIIETCLLTEIEKINMSKCVSAAKAEYIKTSTGFSKSGATFKDVELLSESVDKGVLVKAAGGIASFDDAINYIRLGACRLGTSRLVKIMKNDKENSGY